MKTAEYRVLKERVAALDRLVQTSLANADRAIAKAEQAQEKRFASLNEFRGVLADQQSRFVSRDTLEAFSRQSVSDRQVLHEQVAELRISQQSYIRRPEADAEIATLTTQIAALQGSVSRLLITLLSTLVVTTLGALLWDLTHRR